LPQRAVQCLVQAGCDQSQQIGAGDGAACLAAAPHTLYISGHEHKATPYAHKGHAGSGAAQATCSSSCSYLHPQPSPTCASAGPGSRASPRPCHPPPGCPCSTSPCQDRQEGCPPPRASQSPPAPSPAASVEAAGQQTWDHLSAYAIRQLEQLSTHGPLWPEEFVASDRVTQRVTLCPGVADINRAVSKIISTIDLTGAVRQTLQL
jgi:hypothetical protein